MSGFEHMEPGANSVPDARGEEAALALVVVSLSAGGLLPLRSLIRRLPADLPAAVVVAQHIAGFSILPEILKRESSLPVKFAVPGMRLMAGTIYVCPPRQHIVINPDATIALSDRERIPHRPSGDWLFESASAAFGERLVAVVLSGMREDASRGALHVHARGGKLVVQDPGSCERREMPDAAIATGRVDCVIQPKGLGETVVELIGRLDLARCREQWESPFQLSPSPAA
jgi:two-component system, chemotaxis family, protein-glutamate methylesterase/glutaminase